VVLTKRAASELGAGSKHTGYTTEDARALAISSLIEASKKGWRPGTTTEPEEGAPIPSPQPPTDVAPSSEPLSEADVRLMVKEAVEETKDVDYLDQDERLRALERALEDLNLERWEMDPPLPKLPRNDGRGSRG
jgi:hypothetical protein